MRSRLALAALALLGGCTAVDTDRNPVGSVPAHSVTVIVNDGKKRPTVEQLATDMEDMAMDAARKKCGNRNVAVIRTALLNINYLLMTFRCEVPNA